RFQNRIPTWVGHNLNRLRGKRAIWLRVLTGVALIVAWGFLPLPLVGVWMLPAGLALLAHDIPTVRAPIARLLHFTNGKIEKRKNWAMSALPLEADIAERDRQCPLSATTAGVAISNSADSVVCRTIHFALNQYSDVGAIIN